MTTNPGLRGRFALFVGCAALGLAAIAAGCGNDADDGGAGWEAIEQVTRFELAGHEPAEAPGQVLELTRVVVPAGAEIPAHTHPGTQMAMVAEGVLTYTVLTGEVEVRRAAGSENERRELISAGETAEIRPGDSLVEVPGMAHRAHNRGDSPVLIYISSLFEGGAPASSPYEEGGD